MQLPLLFIKINIRTLPDQITIRKIAASEGLVGGAAVDGKLHCISTNLPLFI